LKPRLIKKKRRRKGGNTTLKVIDCIFCKGREVLEKMNETNNLLKI